MHSRLFLLAALLLVLAAGCAPDPTATPTLKSPTEPTVPGATRVPILPATPTPEAATPQAQASSPAVGEFTFAPGDGSIWIQDAASGQARALVSATNAAFADSPAFSPDGQLIAFTLSTLSQQGVAQNAIHLIGADGKHERALATPPDLKTSFNWPAFSPDGKWVYYTASYPVPPNSEHSEIQRVLVEGGAAQSILTDARTAVVSADGKHLAFLRFNFQTFTAGLWLADAHGKNAKRLVDDSVFAMIGTPRFSPDGQWILFAASGPPSRQLPGALCEPRLLCLIAQPAYADGLPWDLWLVSVDGTRFDQLTKIGSDSPGPAWSRAGKDVAFFDGNGIFLVNLQTRAVSQLSKNGGHGAFDWWQQP